MVHFPTLLAMAEQVSCTVYSQTVTGQLQDSHMTGIGQSQDSHAVAASSGRSWPAGHGRAVSGAVTADSRYSH
eukprot:6229792-Pyramimonas_sp.AAC.1